MYKIYVGDEKVYDSTFPDQHVTAATVERGENQAGSLKMSFTKDAKIFGKYTMLNSPISVKRNGDVIFYGRAINESHDFYNITNVECEGELGFLYDSVQTIQDFSGKQPKDILETLITKHNEQVEEWKQFKIGRVTVVDTTEHYNPDDPSAMYPTDNATSQIKSTFAKTFDNINSLLINRLNGYLKVRHENDGMYIDYLGEYDDGTDNGQVIEFGKNLLDYSDSINYASICTGVIPLGGHGDADPYEMYQTSDDTRLTVESVNNGSEIIWNQSLVNTYGKICSILDLSNINDAQKLYDKGVEYLNDTQFENLTLNCNVVDLSIINPDLEPLQFLKKVRVVSKPHSMDRYFPVTSITNDILNSANDTVTLGMTVNSLTDGLIKQDVALNGANHDIQTNAHVINQNAKSWWKEVHDKNGMSRFEIMADHISSEVRRATAKEGELNNNISSIRQTAESIQTRVDGIANDQSRLSSSITQTAKDITSEITRAKNAESAIGSRITQSVDSIQSSISDINGNVSTISQTANGVQFGLSNLQTGLSNGTTEINGGCIKTGTLSVNQLQRNNAGCIQSNASIDMDHNDLIHIRHLQVSEVEITKIDSLGQVNLSKFTGGNSMGFLRYDPNTRLVYWSDGTGSPRIVSN